MIKKRKNMRGVFKQTVSLFCCGALLALFAGVQEAAAISAYEETCTGYHLPAAPSCRDRFVEHVCRGFYDLPAAVEASVSSWYLPEQEARFRSSLYALKGWMEVMGASPAGVSQVSLCGLPSLERLRKRLIGMYPETGVLSDPETRRNKAAVLLKAHHLIQGAQNSRLAEFSAEMNANEQALKEETLALLAAYVRCDGKAYFAALTGEGPAYAVSGREASSLLDLSPKELAQRAEAACLSR